MRKTFTEKFFESLKEIEMQNKFGKFGFIEANVEGNRFGNIYVERYLDSEGNVKFGLFQKTPTGRKSRSKDSFNVTFYKFPDSYDEFLQELYLFIPKTWNLLPPDQLSFFDNSFQAKDSSRNGDHLTPERYFGR